MNLVFSHTYEDDDGRLVEVMVPEDRGRHRNAGARDHRAQSGSGRGRPAGRPRGADRGGGSRIVVRPNGDMDRPQGDYFSINKSALVELIPSVGEIWASLLGAPQPPVIVGDDVIDRTNAALHRDAIAQHQQNQTRIMALTHLASRAVNLFAR